MPALLAVAAAEPIGVSELARRLGLMLSSTSTIVGELSRAGLLERAEDDQDRRRTIVRVHEDYRRCMEGGSKWRSRRFEAPLERLLTSSARALHGGLAHPARGSHAPARRGWPRRGLLVARRRRARGRRPCGATPFNLRWRLPRRDSGGSVARCSTNASVAAPTQSIAITANTSTTTLPVTAARASRETGIEMPMMPMIWGDARASPRGKPRRSRPEARGTSWGIRIGGKAAGEDTTAPGEPEFTDVSLSGGCANQR